jgi:Ubiquitin family
MRLTRRGDYNPVSSDDETANGLAPTSASGSSTTPAADNNQSSSSNATTRRQNLSLEVVSKEDTPLRESLTATKTLDSDDNDDDDDDDENCNDEAGADSIRVVVLDSAQKRFPIENVNPDWSVSKFKRVGARIHKVGPQQQRLIFRGKMLSDDDHVFVACDNDDNKKKKRKKTLRDYGIHTENDLIIHLFPKPRVVMTTSDSNVSGEAGGGGSGDGGGAHIPSIVIDEEEQQRRGQILVLGSVEIAESQNNVKMLSLLLFVICAMRLLALFSIAMGVVDEPQQDNNGSYGDDLIPPSDRGSGGNNTNSNSTGHHHHGYDPNDPSQQELEQRPW